MPLSITERTSCGSRGASLYSSTGSSASPAGPSNQELLLIKGGPARGRHATNEPHRSKVLPGFDDGARLTLRWRGDFAASSINGDQEKSAQPQSASAQDPDLAAGARAPAGT